MLAKVSSESDSECRRMTWYEAWSVRWNINQVVNQVCESGKGFATNFSNHHHHSFPWIWRDIYFKKLSLECAIAEFFQWQCQFAKRGVEQISNINWYSFRKIVKKPLNLFKYLPLIYPLLLYKGRSAWITSARRNRKWIPGSGHSAV